MDTLGASKNSVVSVDEAEGVTGNEQLTKIVTNHFSHGSSEIQLRRESEHKQVLIEMANKLIFQRKSLVAQWLNSKRQSNGL